MRAGNGGGGNGRKPRLELTWIGKDDRPRLEPRILLPQAELSFQARSGPWVVKPAGCRLAWLRSRRVHATVVHMGAHFARAEADDAYPVSVYRIQPDAPEHSKELDTSVTAIYGEHGLDIKY